MYDPNFEEVESWETYAVNKWEDLPDSAELQVYGKNSFEGTDIGTFEDWLEASYEFLDYNQTVLKSGKVKDGETPVAPADPTRAADAQYTYTFSGWNPTLGPINKNTSFIAQYSTTVNTYSIQFRSGDDSTKWMLVVTGWQYPGEYSTYLIENLPYGTAITVNGSAITVGDITLTATPAAGYAFWGWGEVPATVTWNLDISASFASAEYTVTFVDEDGTTVLDEQTLDYWAMPQYAGEIPTKEATAQYTYEFAWWNPEVTTVTWNATYTATYSSEVNEYYIEIESNDVEMWAVDVGYADVPYWTPISAEGNVLTIWETTITATAGEGYVFFDRTDWEGNALPATVTWDLNIIASFATNVSLENIISCTNRSTDVEVEYKFFGNLLLGKVETDPETWDTTLIWTPVGQDPSAGILWIKAAFEAVDDQTMLPMYMLNNQYISWGFVPSMMTLINNVYNNPSTANKSALTTAIDTAMQEMETFVEWMEQYAYSSDWSSIQLFWDSSSSWSYIDVTVDQWNVTYTPYGIYVSDAGTNVISAISQAMNASDWSALIPGVAAMGDVDEDSYVALGELFGYGSAATSSNITEAAAAVTASLPNFVDFGWGE